MKILFFSYRFFPFVGGIETVSKLVANYLTDQGHEVRVVTTTRSDNNNVLPYNVLYNPSTIKILKSILWADAILENNPCLSLTWPLLFIPKRRVAVIHGPLQDETGTSDTIQKIKKWWVLKAKRALSCSNDINFNKRIIETVGNPYQDDVFKPYLNVKRESNFVFLGRLVSEKGGELMLRAFAKIPENVRKSSTITLVGDGPEHEKLQNLAQELAIEKYIFFKGQLKGNELALELHKYKYILVPSLYREPFGIVALEGMACGCIPLVADDCGLEEAIGKFGYTFKRGDALSLTKMMTSLLSNVNKIMLDSTGTANHLKQFEVKSVCQKYLNAIVSTYDK